MRIAIFENEYQQVESAFQTVNLLFFNNQLVYENFPSSQSIGSIDNLKDYDVAIVDIDLSQNSQLDGYSLLSKIEGLEKKPKVLILTGSSKVQEYLKRHNLPNYDILLKPVDFNEIHVSFDKVFASA